jgi:hypothetical protein
MVTTAAPTWEAATCRGVSPAASTAVQLAPAVSSSLRLAKQPTAAATCSGVRSSCVLRQGMSGATWNVDMLPTTVVGWSAPAGLPCCACSAPNVVKAARPASPQPNLSCICAQSTEQACWTSCCLTQPSSERFEGSQPSQLGSSRVVLARSPAWASTNAAEHISNCCGWRVLCSGPARMHRAFRPSNNVHNVEGLTGQSINACKGSIRFASMLRRICGTRGLCDFTACMDWTGITSQDVIAQSATCCSASGCIQRCMVCVAGTYNSGSQRRPWLHPC